MPSLGVYRSVGANKELSICFIPNGYRTVEEALMTGSARKVESPGRGSAASVGQQINRRGLDEKRRNH